MSAITTLAEHTAHLVALLEAASGFLAQVPISEVQQHRAAATAACSEAQGAIAAALDENIALRAQIRRDGAILLDLSHLSIGQSPPSVLLATIKESAQAALASRQHLIGEEVH